MLFHASLLCFLFVLCTASEDPYFLISTNEKDNRDAYFNDRLTIEKYQPTWESLDSRPLPSWYDDAKLGIFIHWGVFSVPSFGSEWFWKYWKDGNSVKYQNFMKERYPPNFTYQDFARDFTAEFYNASHWTELFEAAGAKYVVLTSKHHEGYTLWPSTHSFSWNAMDVGPHRDLLGELAEAIKSSSNIKFGLYHSLYEWYNPMYLNDKKNHFASNNFVADKIMPELHELVEKYRPEVIWSDGDWEATDSYWTSKEFLAWLYNKSPVKDTVVVNDRWGTNIPCHHGDFYTCSDRYNPGVLQSHKWENCMTIDKMSWGFRRNAVLADYMTLKELVKELVVTVSCGGNLLMNIGPSKDGLILPVFEERLRGMGQWLSINGEAIYGTKPWTVQNDTITGTVWYTQSKYENSLYVHVLDWPKDSVLYLGSVKVPDNTKIHLLGYPNALKWEQGLNKLTIKLPDEAHRGQAAWVLKIQEGPQYK